MIKRSTVMIVEYEEQSRAFLRSLFEDEYNIIEAENSEQAMFLLRQYSDNISIIIIDLEIRSKSGGRFLGEMGSLADKISAIAITSGEPESIAEAFRLGATEIINKPFEQSVVKKRVENIMELRQNKKELNEIIQEHSSSLREFNSSVIDMLSSVIEHRNTESEHHAHRVRLFTKILLDDIARSYGECGFDKHSIQIIADASSMHDIGKIAIPDNVLNKPGSLTKEEFNLMKEHTVKGSEIIARLMDIEESEYLRYAYNICRYHHERWDGNGYPEGLKGDNIPICAQVVGIVDCYDALISKLVYKKSASKSKVFNMILNGECGAFSPKLLESFKNVRKAFEALSDRYADDYSEKPEEEKKALFSVAKKGNNTLITGQMKYLALLKYTDSTVMEVDFNTGVFHLIYLADKDFEALRTGSDFESSIENFVNTAVHHDDRKAVLELFDKYINDFFDKGLFRYSRRCRVLNQTSGDYVVCRATLIRIDTDLPNDRKVLLIWEKTIENEALELPVQSSKELAEQNLVMSHLLGGIQKCINDQYFTMIQINSGFKELVGYTEQEIKEKFDNRFIDFVLPDDRKKLKEQVGKQLNAGKIVEIKYRLMAKDGNIVWVLDRCMLVEEEGREYFYCVLIDITKSKQTEEELRRSLERHNIIMDQTNDILFDWDIKNDELMLSSNWEKKFGYHPITKNVSTEVPRASHIHPDDIPAFLELVYAMNSGMRYKEAEVRFIERDEQYKWYRIRATAQFDENGKPIRAVGVILDIDSQKRTSAELVEKAERDVLTKLYNKGSGTARIKQYMKHRRPDDISALMVIDVDNFKQINDRFGHMFGDAVLTELASKISRFFRSEDIVSRIGGDEFVVFMPNIFKKEIAEKRAKEMIQSIREILKDNLKDTQLSCSVGVSYLIGNDTNYHTLFEQADRALYKAKAAGKSGYAVFDEDMMDISDVFFSYEQQGLRTLIDSDNMPEANMANLINMSFKKLYETANFSQAVNSLIEMLGKLFNVSRVYIFESTPDGRYCSNTYEWCNEGITPEKDFIQNFEYVSENDNYTENFDNDGIFYCQDITKLPERQRNILEKQGVLSMLQCAITERNEFRGFVGLDDCSIKRLWTKEQIEALAFISKMLSIFLLKERAQDKLARSVENLHEVLDNQEAWIYVVNPDTYELRYVNKTTKALVRGAKNGELCYKAFFLSDKPCENCPVQKAYEAGQCVMEIYNPILKVWALTDAAMVNWNGEKACMLSCRDISKYKK